MSSVTPVRKGFFASRRAQNEAVTAYFFIAPYLLMTLVFTIGVILFAIYISFTHYNLYTPAEWAGLENYAKAITNKPFIRSLVNSLWYVIIVVPTQTTLALALAILLNAKVRGSRIFRTVFYAPSVTSSVVISMIFWWLYLPNGYLNLAFTKGLAAFGAQWEIIEFLNDPRGLIQLIVVALGGDIPYEYWYLRGPSVTWMAIMFQNIFTTAPTFMIMFLAALQDVPNTLYEASSIDGASKQQQFWKITVPMLRPVILMIVVLGTIGTWQVFDQVKVLTSGGPLDTTLTPVYLIYAEAFGINAPPRMGFAGAMAFILTTIIFVFTYIQRRTIESGTEQY